MTPVRNKVDHNVFNQIQVRNQARLQVFDYQVRDQVRDKVEDRVWDKISCQVYIQIKAQMKSKKQ